MQSFSVTEWEGNEKQWTFTHFLPWAGCSAIKNAIAELKESDVVKKTLCCSCNFLWIAGEWEPCSATCGTTGVQNRELYCVPQSILNAVVYSNNDTVLQEPWRYMVSPAKCPGAKPLDVQSCNRTPCVSFWVYDEWSEVRAHFIYLFMYIDINRLLGTLTSIMNYDRTHKKFNF